MGSHGGAGGGGGTGRAGGSPVERLEALGLRVILPRADESSGGGGDGSKEGGGEVVAPTDCVPRWQSGVHERFARGRCTLQDELPF